MRRVDDDELPRDTVPTPYPVTSSLVRVPNGADLQVVLNSAKPGDLIALAPGAVFTGDFLLPKHAGAGATIDVGSLLNAAVLDFGGPGGMESFAHCDAYDGNVPLAGDLSFALGATLDHLTTSSSLFDVPALYILCVDGLDT